jgi:MarR family
MDAIEEIRQRVESRLDELRPFVEEARRLESVLAAIQSMPKVEETEDTPSAPRGMRLPVEVRKNQVLAYLVQKGHARIGEIADALGVSHARAVQLANQLEKDKLVRRTHDGVEITSAGGKQAFGMSFKVGRWQKVQS